MSDHHLWLMSRFLDWSLIFVSVWFVVYVFVIPVVQAALNQMFDLDLKRRIREHNKKVAEVFDEQRRFFK